MSHSKVKPEGKLSPGPVTWEPVDSAQLNYVTVSWRDLGDGTFPMSVS